MGQFLGCDVSRQQGAALLLMMLTIIAAISLALIGIYGGSRNQIRAQQATTTAQSLGQAKLALIAWSLSRKYTSYNQDRPGELPCPDLHSPGDTDEGNAGSTGNVTCNSNVRRIGRLPWRALGLPRLVDGAGEPLWYMVVAPLNDSETAPLNSSTPIATQLQVDANNGALSYPAAVAIIFAPGSALSGQSRNDATQQRAASNYLEQSGIYNNASNNPTARRLNGPLVDASNTPVLNDQLVTITAGEIMPKVLQRALLEYPAALKRRYTSPYPPALEGSCIGTPPDAIKPGSDSNWLNRNEWETLLSYDCTDMSIQKK